VLPNLPQRIREAAIDVAALKDAGVGNPEDVPTSWAYDLRIDQATIPLYEACARRLRFFLSAAGLAEEEREKTLTSIDRIARSSLKVRLCENEPPYDWLYRYLRMDVLTKDRSAGDSEPQAIAAAIREVAHGFFDEAKTGGPASAWRLYRDYLLELPKRDIFGSDFGIQDLYVLPSFSYYRQGHRSYGVIGPAQTAEAAEVRANLMPFLTELISKRTPQDNMVLIFGDPGVGKTSFAQSYSAALAQDEAMHPVFIVSFRQACMKIFAGAGIVGCRRGSLRRTADEHESHDAPARRPGEGATTFRTMAADA
jgi:hypothetical protein